VKSTTDIVQTAAILISVLGLLYQLRREWLLHSAEMVTNLVAQFNSEDFEKRRRNLAAHLELVVSGKPVSLTSDYGLGVLGFYENLSHLVRRRALDEMMVWTKFSWELVCYFQCITTEGNALAVERMRNGDPTLYEEMEWLNARFVRIYRRKGASLYKDSGRVRWLEDFFLQEKNLGSYTKDSGPLFSERPETPVAVSHLEAMGKNSEKDVKASRRSLAPASTADTAVTGRTVPSDPG
jgi:hypothetical protein